MVDVFLYFDGQKKNYSYNEWTKNRI
jgi:hypothetical protein